MNTSIDVIIFSQDNYFEEAFKMRNVLQELLKPHSGQRRPTILGLREHIFTGRFVVSFEGLINFICRQTIYNYTISCVTPPFLFDDSVSSLAWFMSNQETSFVTIAQRILANPLR